MQVVVECVSIRDQYQVDVHIENIMYKARYHPYKQVLDKCITTGRFNQEVRQG